ncbi:DUF3813 domain-containing protein [Bacillus sp. FJAT-47783]|uniref:DUF3813 domain-containing protein n=1 Tax=Bacillus sp. FJAT-47783 TaxID=2922712 RepID=UPI001FACA924|nr:DUF3813 domain-containing protein [Bacillus sp. FJAT-47783]
MGNRLFKEARQFVQEAERIASGEMNGHLQEAIAKAQNALTSAYANSTTAEKIQLSEFQQTLDQIK